MDLPPGTTPNRTVIKQGQITITYGTDVATGYFIQAVDERLSYKSTNTAGLNVFCESIAESGGGQYMDAHPGTYGFGTKVDVPTMKKLWELYVADVSGIKE